MYKLCVVFASSHGSKRKTQQKANIAAQYIRPRWGQVGLFIVISTNIESLRDCKTTDFFINSANSYDILEPFSGIPRKDAEKNLNATLYGQVATCPYNVAASQGSKRKPVYLLCFATATLALPETMQTHKIFSCINYA